MIKRSEIKKKISFLKAVTEKYNARLNKNVICQKFSKNDQNLSKMSKHNVNYPSYNL